MSTTYQWKSCQVSVPGDGEDRVRNPVHRRVFREDEFRTVESTSLE
ncbi:MAG: hypothetical protein MK077_00875 [Phycisphaerales bacterium]|nr:hypothetical protein [Phycisphaerales bacterium]